MQDCLRQHCLRTKNPETNQAPFKPLDKQLVLYLYIGKCINFSLV